MNPFDSYSTDHLPNGNRGVKELLLQTHERLAASDAPGALHALLGALQRIGASGEAIEAVDR